MNKSIVVVGSSNTDMVIKTRHIPAPGETILGGTFFMTAGGKGANQAVAAARLGGIVTFVTKIGDDIFGKKALGLYEEEGIDTKHIFVDPALPSGVAMITVDEKGENCIVVAPGANAALQPGDLVVAKDELATANIILMQLEIPLDTVRYVAKVAAEHNTRLILNPAPACILSDGILSSVSVITPNKQEAAMLTGTGITDVNDARVAAKLLADKGIETVIITLGAEGALILADGTFTIVPALPVAAVDTTAAGDIFNGALVVAICEGKSMEDAVHFANRAAAISVTRLGAQASAPYRDEVDAQLSQLS